MFFRHHIFLVINTPFVDTFSYLRGHDFTHTPNQNSRFLFRYFFYGNIFLQKISSQLHFLRTLGIFKKPQLDFDTI